MNFIALCSRVTRVIKFIDFNQKEIKINDINKIIFPCLAADEFQDQI